jgi:hypothetical protein
MTRPLRHTAPAAVDGAYEALIQTPEGKTVGRAESTRKGDVLAYARLFATAPRLLEALQSADDLLTSIIVAHPSLPEVNAVFDQFDDIREVIATAMGQHPPRTRWDPPGQPTITELSSAWTNAIECENIGGARSETLAELIRLRDLRQSWLDDQFDMMRGIDNYIAGALGKALPWKED